MTSMRRRGARTLIGAVTVMTIGLGCSDDAQVMSSDSSSSVPGQTSFGSDARVDLAVYFFDGVSDAEITNFISEVLSKPSEAGRPGQDHLDGVQYTGGDYTRDAVYVTFFPEATETQRQSVLDAVQASSLVERIDTDVVPSETPLN